MELPPPSVPPMPEAGRRSGLLPRIAAVAALWAVGLATWVTLIDATGDQECRGPAAESIATVTQIVDSPRPMPPDLDGSRSVSRKERSAFLEQQREDLGIEYPTADSEVISKLEIALNQNQDVPTFSAYYDVLHSVMDQLHIPVHILQPDEQLPGDTKASVPTSEELEKDEAKYQVLQLIKAFSSIPTSLGAHLGIKQIVLTANGSSSYFAYAGEAYTNDGTVIIDLVNPPEGQYGVPEHELYHIFNAFYCGGTRPMHNDPGYERLSPEDNYANDYELPPNFLSSRPRTFEDIDDEFYRLSRAMHDASDRNDRTTYCQLEAELIELGKYVVEMDAYSYTYAVESEATIGGRLFNPADYGNMLDSYRPMIREKFIYMLAELYETHPNIVRYYALIATRPGKPVFTCTAQIS